MTRSTRPSSSRLSLRPKAGASLPPAPAPAPASSPYPTPPSFSYPSACPREDEAEDEAEADNDNDNDNDNHKKDAKPAPTFPFLTLPSELRNKIYSMVFSSAPSVIDLDPSVFRLLNSHRILALFSVSKQIYCESNHLFFSTHTIRLFPTYPGRYFKAKKPLLARLPAHYRESLTTLELRLGPGWNNPPRGWIVNDALGLGDCNAVRVLKVFVEVDPSEAIFKGFSAGDGFYERFSQALLRGVLKGVPSIQVVEFDAYPSVKRTGEMMRGLGEVIAESNKVVGWGPERGWEKESDQVWLGAMLSHEGGKLSKSIAVFA